MVNFESADALEEYMSRPTPALQADLARAGGDLLILGVGGKMGPTLARMAKRAAPAKRVIGVARFSDKALRAKLEAQGVECIECDLLERAALERLPQAAQRGVHGRAQVRRRRQSRLHLGDERGRALDGGGDVPQLAHRRVLDRLRVSLRRRERGAARPRTRRPCRRRATTPPPASAREMAFAYGSLKHGTAGRLVRLEYAIDMRYGVLHDVGTQGVQRASRWT